MDIPHSKPLPVLQNAHNFFAGTNLGHIQAENFRGRLDMEKPGKPVLADLNIPFRLLRLSRRAPNS
jgi:hypothetical protein